MVVGTHHLLGRQKSVAFESMLGYPWILQPTGSPMLEVLDHKVRVLQIPLSRDG